MSLNSSPNHGINNPFENYYDPSFTAEISSKMHVPDKICVVEGIEPPPAFSSRPEEIKSRMSVPERIIVAGDNKHIAMREPIPELKFESRFPMNFPNLVLASPPDILTVDEYPYSSVEPPPKPNTKRVEPVFNEKMHSDLNESSMSCPSGGEEDIAVLRRQLRHISRRVLSLEQESQLRQQREFLICILGLAYITFKGLVWLHRRF